MCYDTQLACPVISRSGVCPSYAIHLVKCLVNIKGTLSILLKEMDYLVPKIPYSDARYAALRITSSVSHRLEYSV